MTERGRDRDKLERWGNLGPMLNHYQYIITIYTHKKHHMQEVKDSIAHYLPESTHSKCTKTVEV